MSTEKLSLEPGEKPVSQSQPFVRADSDDSSDNVIMQANNNVAGFGEDSGVFAESNCDGLKRRHSETFSGKDTQIDSDPKKPREGKGIVEIGEDVARVDTEEDTIKGALKDIKKDIVDIKSHILDLKKVLLDVMDDIKGGIKDDTKEQSKDNPEDHTKEDHVMSAGDDPSPKLELIDQNEAFAEKDGDFVFDHTRMILRRGKDYFLATADRGVPELKDLEIDTLDLTPIPPEHFRPKVKHGITQAPESLPDVYVKRPCLFDWDPSDTNPEHISDLVLQEAGICEILTKHPHPNIVRYFGCLVEDGRISGLCLAKYNSKLSEKLVNSSVAKREMYYEGIKKGIHHLHQLGFIHNDLNPSNIMMDGNTPVIIDFDSCRPNGEKLGAKAGTFKWELEEATFATPENDFYSLAKLRDFILKGNER